jgi:pimeloyl-ACP methyl ester carboxylesterase
VDLNWRLAVRHPKTSYAKRDGVNIAYQVLGDGPLDLVYVPGFISHLDLQWTVPEAAATFLRVASFSRLILFDKRGTGLSDPTPAVPTLEERWKTCMRCWTPSAQSRQPFSECPRAGL